MSVTRQHEIIDTLLYIFLGLFFIYAFWYQYAFTPVGAVFPSLGGIIFALSILNIKISRGFYKELGSIYCFIIVISSFGILVAFDMSATINQVKNIIEYTIPMLGVYTFVNGQWKNFTKILRLLIVAITLVAFSSLISGHVTNTGAIVVGNLNANVESSFMAMAIISCIIIISVSTSKFEKILICISAILCFKAQIDCASRRGFILLLFLLILGGLFSVEVKYKKKKIAKWLIVIMAICVALILITSFSNAFESTTLFERFMTDQNEGDRLRSVYQGKALTLFLRSPLFGTGLGYVAIYAGMYSHSMYFELLACTGILGTSIIVISLIRFIIKFYKISILLDDFEQELIIGARCMALFTVSILLGGVAVVYIYDMYFYVMLGVIASMSKILEDKLKKIF